MTTGKGLKNLTSCVLLTRETALMILVAIGMKDMMGWGRSIKGVYAFIPPVKLRGNDTANFPPYLRSWEENLKELTEIGGLNKQGRPIIIKELKEPASS